MTKTETAPPTSQSVADILNEIQRRVLWLAVRMVDTANHDRPDADGVKVGGHQASSASLVTTMTVLYFAFLDSADRVSVKPHASPVFHAIQYLLGNLDREYLTTLRAFGGLQAYPSRTKDPDAVDFSTGSVGLGAAAPLFAAVTRRYVDAHFGARPASRFISLLGDAELDEGNVWEAINDDATHGLGNVTWIVDFNRQSLDRIVPGPRIAQWRNQFAAAGWHVVEAKYGSRLQDAFTWTGGEHLRMWLDRMPNEQYQSLFGLPPSESRERFLHGAPDAVRTLCDRVDDDQLAALVTDLAGHDPAALLAALHECDREVTRPSVVFAYTVKGWGLPIAGSSRNHSALLNPQQLDELRAACRLTPDSEGDAFDPTSDVGRWIAGRRDHLARPAPTEQSTATLPGTSGLRAAKPVSTQESFGRILVNLSRHPAVAPFLVTTAPDVATSTNLAGFINRTGVFTPRARQDWSADSAIRWTEGPAGQHIELGISEMNLFLLLGQLGLSGALSDQPLLPVGTVYDPFVLRGLDALIHAVYSGSRFVIAGTPSGVTLAPEGGAHQSTITPSVGLELPNLTFIEPAYSSALDWLLCSALASIAATSPDERSYYFRLTTRAIDQSPFDEARTRLGDAVLRRQVLAGAYRLVDASGDPKAPAVHLVASGAVVPEVLAAAQELKDEGVAAHVVDVTSADRLYRSWQHSIRHAIRRASAPSLPGCLRSAFPAPAPIVTVHDASSHTLSWLGSALGVPAVSLGVEGFGQSGTVADLYRANDLDPGSITNAALAALSLG